MEIRKHALICALSATAWLALPLAAQAQTYSDPIISNPPPEQGDSSGSGGNHGGGAGSQTPPPPTGSSQTGRLTDATGQTATITLDNKALQFQSSGRRVGPGIEYDAGLDSAQGGGSNGGFPFWEGNGDWQVTKSARCVVDGYKKMKKVAGTKEQSFSCYVEWMQGNSKQYVDLSHCLAGANNTKLDATKETVRDDRLITSESTISYLPGTCPHPEWVIGSWSSWWNTSGWYRASAHRARTCGTVTEHLNQKRTRSASCENGSNAECKTFNGPVKTTDTRTLSRSRNLGACALYSRNGIVENYQYSWESCWENRHTTHCRTNTRTDQHIDFSFTFKGHSCTFTANGYTNPAMAAGIRCDGTGSASALKTVKKVKIGNKVLTLNRYQWIYSRDPYRSCSTRMGERECRTKYGDPYKSGYSASFEGRGVDYITGRAGNRLNIQLLP